MSRNQAEHASKVVETFRSKLSKSGIEHVGQKHFDELALLIEAAIDSAVFSEMETVADKISQISKEIRDSAERFD